MISLILLFFYSLASAIPTASDPPLAKRQALNCPLYLPSNNYEFPHLIVPISSSSPDATLGNTFTPAISPNDISTIFNFDIPISRAGQTCTLYFTFPTQSQLVTTSYTFWGKGTFRFDQYRYNSGATAGTTWKTQPPLSDASPIELTQVAPGRSYRVWSGSCGPGGLLSWRMGSGDSCLWWFQDWNDCAIGVYVVYE